MMYLRNEKEKLNNKGFTLIELVVSIAIMVIVFGAIGILLSGSLNNFDYNQTTIGLQIDSQQYAQRIGNAIQTTGYAIYTERRTDDVDDLYLYALDRNSGSAQNVICEVYKAKDTGATYNDGGTRKPLYTIEHFTYTMPKADFDSASGSASWTGTGDSEPLTGSVASIHYNVYDNAGKLLTSGAYTGSESFEQPKKVTIEVGFLSKNRKLKLDDATFFFRNSTVNYRFVSGASGAAGSYKAVYTNKHPDISGDGY